MLSTVTCNRGNRIQSGSAVLKKARVKVGTRTCKEERTGCCVHAKARSKVMIMGKKATCTAKLAYATKIFQRYFHATVFCLLNLRFSTNSLVKNTRSNRATTKNTAIKLPSNEPRLSPKSRMLIKSDAAELREGGVAAVNENAIN